MRGQPDPRRPARPESATSVLFAASLSPRLTTYDCTPARGVTAQERAVRPEGALRTGHSVLYHKTMPPV